MITVLRTGDYFGELALLSRERRTATVRAQGYCDLSILTRMSLDRLLDVYPEMEPAMKKVGRRLRDFRAYGAADGDRGAERMTGG